MDLKTIQTLQTEIEKILELLDIDFVLPSVEVDEEEVVKVDLRPDHQQAEEAGASMGMIIGSKGETLSAMEYLLALMVNRGRENWYRIRLDVDGYRRRREEELSELAKRTAERVRSLGEAIALRSMPNYERRVIHLTLSQTEGIVTESTGEGRKRRVVVKPK